MQSRFLLVSFGIGILSACSPTSSIRPTVQAATNYVCANGMKIAAAYDNSVSEAPKVALTIDGKAYALAHAVSASGARYTSMSGMTEGKALEWWTKGGEGTLSEGPKDDKRLLAESVQVTTCKESR